METNVTELRNILNGLFEKNCEGFDTPPMDKQKVFISISDGFSRARTFVGLGNSIKTAYVNCLNLIIKHVKKIEKMPKYIYMDFVTDEETLDLNSFYERLKSIKRNYSRYGISFDEFYNFSFLEQEMNGSALYDYSDESNPVFNDGNITSFLRRKGLISRGQQFNQKNLEKIILFNVKSFFYDETGYMSLYSSGLEKGIRTNKADRDFLLNCIEKTGEYLLNTVNEDGSFIYGYFSCYCKLIPSYNIIRHCLSVMALMDVYRVTKDERYLNNIKLSYEYVIKTALKRIDDERFVIVDHTNDDEIRLGALGLGIIMILQYAETTGSYDDIHIAYKLANSIMNMQDKDTGRFVHVLKYPDLEVVDEFRIVYYSGEACYGLMKLYAYDNNNSYLAAVEKAFEYFIANDYHKYYDHWLSYSVNELTKFTDEDKYFEFGLKNAFYRIDFITERITTWATFLELLNAAFQMVERVKSQNKGYLLEGYELEKLTAAIESRIAKQLNGVMFPEMAMFFANPDQILYGAYIKHHSFRIRDDDVAHHLIGYCHFIENVMDFLVDIAI